MEAQHCVAVTNPKSEPSRNEANMMSFGWLPRHNLPTCAEKYHQLQFRNLSGGNLSFGRDSMENIHRSARGG